jgi:hypothetical protein
MKSKIYDAHASLNAGCDLTLESLTTLQQEGVLTADYVQQQTEILEEIRAGMNARIHNKMQSREREDEDHYGKMRATTARRMRGEQTIEGPP